MTKQPKNLGERWAIALALTNAKATLHVTLGTEDLPEVIADKLTDLRHLCHTMDIDFFEALDRSYTHYRAERFGRG